MRGECSPVRSCNEDFKFKAKAFESLDSNNPVSNPMEKSSHLTNDPLVSCGFADVKCDAGDPSKKLVTDF